MNVDGIQQLLIVDCLPLQCLLPTRLGDIIQNLQGRGKISQQFHLVFLVLCYLISLSVLPATFS